MDLGNGIFKLIPRGAMPGHNRRILENACCDCLSQSSLLNHCLGAVTHFMAHGQWFLQNLWHPGMIFELF